MGSFGGPGRRLRHRDRGIVLRCPAFIPPGTKDRTGEQCPNAAGAGASIEQHQTTGCHHPGSRFAADFGTTVKPKHQMAPTATEPALPHNELASLENENDQPASVTSAKARRFRLRLRMRIRRAAPSPLRLLQCHCWFPSFRRVISSIPSFRNPTWWESCSSRH